MAKATSDMRASELISRSLSARLSSDEQKDLDSYLANSDKDSASEAKAFANWSAIIERSVIEASQDEQQLRGTTEGLSQVAKERLKRSVRQATRASLSQTFDSSSDQLLVAENNQTSFYTHADQSEESRKAESRFTLLRKIGEGGLGTVWLARDEVLKRNVALKEMTARAAQSPKLWQRFQREAEITGHLEHPNVVPLYMSGINPQTGLPFYVMRFLGKQTLSESIREYQAKLRSGAAEQIDLHRLLNAFLRVCEAIAFAHSKGVIHRDLKPENVVLDSFGQVLVLDWGLAKLQGDGELSLRLTLHNSVDDSQLNHTLHGDVVGTPLYMAPEQAAGDLDAVDARTDVYGLGAILFAILTGAAPHDSTTGSSDGQLRVRDFLNAIVTADTPSPRDIDPSLPKELEAICLRAMAKEKFARHTSALELAEDVERWIAGTHEKESRYDALRMSARDLKSRFCVQLRELGGLAKFMVELPPIQGLIDAQVAATDNGDVTPTTTHRGEDFATWKDRLAQIFMALVRTKGNISGLSYCQIDGDNVTELVRIERSLRDSANVRAIPSSRLRKGSASTFHKIVMEQFPGEGHIDFDRETAGSIRIACGVPVFDQHTEEPFGFVVAEAELSTLAESELAVIGAENDVFLADDHGAILFTTAKGVVAGRNGGKPATNVADVLSQWPHVRQRMLEAGCEYLDPDREIYAACLPFPKGHDSIHILFGV